MSSSANALELGAAAAAASSPAEYLALARRIDALEASATSPIVRLACLSSFTLEFCRPFLVVEAYKLGFRLEIYFGPFGQFEQPLVEPTSALWAFQPDALLLAMRAEDLSPDAVVRFLKDAGAEFASVEQSVRARVAHCHQLFRARCQGPVLIANQAIPAQVPLGVFDAHNADSLTHAVAQANMALARALEALPGAVIWDYAGLVREAGSGAWTDQRFWATGRIAVAAKHQSRLGYHLTRTLLGAISRPAKCLVLDLDNTLWGGAVGDVGLEGIELGDDYPGNAYKTFQRAVLGLADRGILLAIVSKNNEAIALDVFAHHPEMLIRGEDLAGVRINWDAKSGNLKVLAKELNIGLDALVLFDDNPVERAEVRANAPEVGVIEVPNNVLAYPEALSGSGYFDQVHVSEEDRGRVGMYRQDRQRRALVNQLETVEEFLASLEMQVTVGSANAVTLGRISQLIGKTNQFNLTTRRHSMAEVEMLSQSSNHVVAWLRLGDRFGDQGLVAVGILDIVEEDAVIDTFLMSCRVMNRGVEKAFAAYLAEEAVRHGCSTLVGTYRPTSKNAMVEDFYPSLGFTPVPEESTDGESRYRLDLVQREDHWPAYIRRQPVEVG